MNDMSQVIIPKSDQINADSLIAGPMTVTVREVQIRGGQEQPVSIMLEQTDLAYRPCKSMSRVLVQAWGADASKYVGRSLTLYRDPTVKWGGMEVGGIRISHLSHIDSAISMVLTATKGSKKPFKVQPLKATETHDPQTGEIHDPAAIARKKAENWTEQYLAAIKECATPEQLMERQQKSHETLTKLSAEHPDLHELTVTAGKKRAAELQETAEA
jgi:hypothetical protein